MYDFEIFKAELIIYIIAASVTLLIIGAFLNIIFLILHLTKAINEPKCWIILNVVLFVILLGYITPELIDIQQSSYYTIDNIVDIDFHKNKHRESILVTNESGKVYTFYKGVVDSEELKDIEYPGTVVYAKHSKLLLRYYVEDSFGNDSK